MRFSSARARSLSKKIAAELLRRGAVVASSELRVADCLVKVFDVERDLQEKLDEEVEAMLSKNHKLPPPGTSEYRTAFEQAKRTLALRKGIKL